MRENPLAIPETINPILKSCVFQFTQRDGSPALGLDAAGIIAIAGALGIEIVDTPCITTDADTHCDVEAVAQNLRSGVKSPVVVREYKKSPIESRYSR